MPMIESLTISKKSPASKSMDFVALREIGIQRIQELAGRLWTDYNTHDPGVTMLEAMSYVLTDLGYRANYDIKDILTPAPGDNTDFKNFYAAREILPVCPVTFNDYRKLLIDVEVVDENDELCKHAGVKNAWIQKSGAKAANTDGSISETYLIPPAEQKIYIDRKYSKLSLDPVDNILPVNQESYYAKTLYDVLLEFDKCERFGDLNTNFSELNFTLTQPEDPFRVQLRVDFKRWDELAVDWNLPLDLSMHIESIRMKFPGLSVSNELVLKGGLSLSFITSKQGGLDFVSQSFLNDVQPFIQQLFEEYVLKVKKILEIVKEVKATLHRNRNLCDDFYRISALKVEEILLCSDIELSTAADVEEVEAEILFQIANFLSPQVNFYTLQEMLNRCRWAIQYPLTTINKNKRIFTIANSLEEDINADDTISVLASDTNIKEYTVKCIRTNRENPNFTDIEVQEEVVSEEMVESAVLIKGTIEEDRCLTVDKIFEGPKLKHGFIDDEELEKAKRMKYIHVSDLIKIIMDVEGVIAVRNIQIANRPLDNDDSIPSQSVKWCLKLAFENNYVPRLNAVDSTLTFFKEQIPFIGKQSEVETIIQNLEKEQRPQKIYYPDLDIPVPVGTHQDLEEYTSLQEDLPTVYGVSSRGIPGLGMLKPAERDYRLAQAKQLKGFLLFFDQLMANYLSQLEHVKDLFSMNNDKDEFGNYAIDKTYFSQPLNNVVPNAQPLYVNPAGHIVALKQIVEDQDLYDKRRNKFLDHLLGRFAETFTDYALLIYQASGAKAPAELIEDKLNFLEAYPALSASRGKGFNYLHPCLNWHIENQSGLEQRASLLLGMPERSVTSLVFSPHFKIIETAGVFTFEIFNEAQSEVLLQSPVGINYNSLEEVKVIIEEILINASCREKYNILPSDPPGQFSFQLVCEEEILAVSAKTDFTSDALGGDTDLYIDDLIGEVILPEFCNNHEANRKNLAPPIFNYITYTVTPILIPPEGQVPQYEIDYSLYDEAFAFTNDHLLLSGKVVGPAAHGDTAAEIVEKGDAAAMRLLCDVVAYGTKRKNYAFDATDDPYTLVLCNRVGVEIGRSPFKNYNEAIVDEIIALSSGQVEIGSGNVFDVNAAIDHGAEVEIQLAQTPDIALVTSLLSYTQSFSILGITIEDRKFEVNLNPEVRIFPGDEIEIVSGSNEGTYTVFSIDTSGPNTIIQVKETIPTEDLSGTLAIKRSYEIANISGNSVFIKAGDDERLINNLIDFLIDKFTSNEGMHLIEHTLLRPRINEKVWKIANAETLDETLLEQGQIYFEKSVPIQMARTNKKLVLIAGNFENEIKHAAARIIGGSPNDGAYTIFKRKYYTAGNRTLIKLKEPLFFDLPAPGHGLGRFAFIRNIDITAIESTSRKIILHHPDGKHIKAGSMVQIKGSGGIKKNNNGRYLVESVNTLAANQYEIIIGESEEKLQDRLLAIHLDKDDCDSCNIVDPYSCVISVVLPYWAGKFTNLAIRNFIQKTIRLEAPAHLLLNICWIDCEQMAEFECKYKKWLIQIGKKDKDKEAQVQALAELIDIIDRLRNVYPSGTLHSCDDDDTFEDAIILNNSVLGTF
jgi:hypothetical protein